MKKNNYTQSWYRVFSLIFLLAVGVISATAQTASVTGDWSLGATWGGSVPATTGTTASPVSITVNTAITLTVSTSITGVYNIAVNGTGILNITSTGVLNATNVTVAGTGATGAKITMATGGVLNVTGTVTINAGATSTWVPPSANVTGVKVQAYSGGGGGSGASSSSNWYSAGGGAGGNFISAIPTGLSTSTVYSVAAGAGGAAGGTGSLLTLGGLGGTSSFSTGGTAIVSIPGGSPGFGGTAQQKQGQGGINGGVYSTSFSAAGTYTNAATPKLIMGTQWAASTAYTLGQQVANGANLYTVTAAGTSTATGPTNTSGSSSAGTTGAVFTYAGVAATAISSSLTSGAITYVQFTPGSGYTAAPSIIFDQPWSAGQSYTAGYIYSNGGNLYQVSGAGTSGTTGPTGTSTTATAAGTGGTATYIYVGATSVRAVATASINAFTISTSGTVNYSATPTIVPANATYFLGGKGGDGVYTASQSTNSSGSGGGSASSTANGIAGNNAVAGTGGAAVAGGLSGSSGAGATVAGLAAVSTAGGAGTGIGNGGGGATSVSKAGGVGSPGQVILSYTSLTLTGTLSALSTTYGTASSNTSFTISSPSNLFSNITVTPPAGYEVSTASDFSTNVGTNSAGSTVSSGASFPVTVYVRLAATASVASSPYSGNITVASTGYSTTIATASSTVSKATLTVSSGVSANNKSFDNSTTATFSFGSAVLSGYQNSDNSSNVSVSAVAGTFASVGAYNTTTSGISVTISSITLAGAAGGNYQITSFPSLTADITPTVSPTVILGALGNGGTFGNVTVGQSPTTTFTITTLNLTGVTTNITAPSGFSVSPTSVSGNVSTTVTLTFSPSAAISYSGNVSVAASGASTVTAAVSGTGLAPAAVTGLSIQYTSDNTQQLSWTSPSSTYDKVLVFASTSSTPYTASGAGSAYTGSNANISSATTYGGYSLVYAGTGTSVEVTSLTAGTPYYYTVVSYASSVYSTVATANGSTLSLPAAVTGLAATSANTQSVVTWTNPSNGTTQSNYWDNILVIAYPTSGSIPTPTGNGSAYTASASYGSGTAIGSGFVVYNGTSSTVTVTGLPNLTPFTFKAFTRHGSVWSVVATATATPSLYASGDFVSIANGNYNTTSTWNTWNGSALVTTASTPSASNNVWIDGGYIVALSAAGSCKDIHVINGTIEAGSYTGAVLTATTLPTTIVLTVAGSTIEVQSGGKMGVPLTGTQTGDDANGFAINTSASGASSSSLSTVTIFGTGGTIDIARLIINANNQNLVISHDLNLYYHSSSNAGNGQAFGVAGTTSTNWTEAVTISSGATLKLGQLAGFSLASSTGTIAQVNFTLNVSGTINFIRGRTPTAVTANAGSNGYLALNTASGYTASVNILNGGNIYATEFYPNGLVPITFLNGGGQISTVNIASGGTLSIDSVIDLRNSNQTIIGNGTFKVLTRAATTANNASASLVKIGGSSLDAQVQVTTTPSYDAYTTFSFEGTSAQTSGTGANGLPTSIYNLQVNNSAGLTLSQATTVLDSVKMVSGLLNTTSSNLLTIGAPNPTSLVQATSTSYVNGPLAVTVASTSSTVRTFPIGANGVYSPVTLNVTQNTTSPRTYTANANVGGTTPSFTNATGTIATIDPKRYYILSSTGSGSITSAYVTLGYSTAADVNASINSFITTSASRMRVVGSTGTSWTDLGGTGVATSSGVGSVTSASNFNTLGTFAVANAISLNVPPDLIAAPTASVSANYDITYTDDPTWRAAITSVVFGTTTLVRNTDYTISSGKITIIPNGSTGSLLRTAGTYTITVNATGYDVVSQDKVVSTGVATKLYVQRAPVATSNGVAFSTQPIVYIVDAYNNLVSGATDNITPSNGGASNWSLGGTVTPLTTTSGIATFTNLSGASATAITATITFTSTSYGSVTSSFSLAAPPTYYWVGGTTATAWNTTNVWSTTKGGSPIATFTPSATDVLIFDGSNIGGGATGTIQTWGPTSSTTVGRIILQNNANVSLTPNPSGSKTYIIGGLYGADLSISSGSTLSTNASNTTTINIASGATAEIFGKFNLGPTAFSSHVLQAVVAGSVQFNSGSELVINGNSSASPFGTSASTPYGTTGSIVFNEGSKLTWNKSGDIFGGNKVVTFKTGSLFYIVYNAPAAQLLMDGNDFANIEVNNAGTATSNSGTSGFTCQSLKLSNTSRLIIGSTGGTCSYGSITTDAGATLTLNTAPTGTLNNSGTINFTYSPVTLSGTIGGTIGLTGTSAAQSLNASGTLNLNNLTINNTAVSSPGVTLSGAVNLTGTLTVTTGTFATGNNLTLKSTSITNTAIVGTVGGTITGTVTVERFIPFGYRGYRDLAPQVYNSSSSTGSIFKNWQENGDMPKPSGNTYTSGTGIFITGSTAQLDNTGANYANATYTSGQPAANSSNGLDYSINANNSAYKYVNGSLYTAINSGFVAITDTKAENLDAFSGYRVIVRGDRSFNLATTPIINYYNLGLRMYNATKLRTTGNLVYGTVTYNSSGVTATVNGNASATLSTNGLTSSTINGFSMIANPYACPVLWGTGTNTNGTTTVIGTSGTTGINGSYWYLDPTQGGTGKYIAFNAQTGSATVGGSTYPGSYNGTTNNAAGYIQPGQAFFVQNSTAAPVVKFTESCKAVNSTKSSVFGVTNPLSKIYLSLLKEDSATVYNRKDGAAVAFSSSFGNTTYGPQDALKFGNSNDNLYISDKGKNLSIDGRLPATANDVFPIALNKMSGKNYKLVVDASIYDANGYALILKDNYKGTVKELSLGIDTVTFTVDTTIAASFANRFSLGFKPTTLAVNSIVACATLNNKIATISWNTVGEKGISRFEVEKSTDAKAFTKIGQAIAKNTAAANYSTTENGVIATSYYRIKAISEVGTVSYSNIVKLSTLDSKLSTYSLYPNPLKGTKVVNVSLTNVVSGKYTITVTSVLGQKVHEASISHQGGSSTHAITITNALASGTYTVLVRDASNQSVYKSNLSVQP